MIAFFCRPRFSAVLLMLFVALAIAATALSPKDLLADIQKHGAKAVVAKLTAAPEDRDWGPVLAEIATGDPQWLRVAAKLASGTDAGASSGLQIALATALPNNPEGVLALVGNQAFLSIQGICGAPFIEPSDEFLHDYTEKTKRALMRMPRGKWEQRRVACLKELNTPWK